jgi:translation initiation factor 2 beta subunit (eIF-2beta)/eIF-5
MQPIRGKTDIIDPFYRYKMEKIVFRTERTKTSIMNLGNIAENLKIPDSECIVAFFKKRLAMQMTHGAQGLIISRHVDPMVIQDSLYEFIDYFVLCKNCLLPELTYVVKGKQIVCDCAGCGSSNEIKSNQYTDPVIKHMRTIIQSQNLGSTDLDDKNVDNEKTKKKKEKKNMHNKIMESSDCDKECDIDIKS